MNILKVLMVQVVLGLMILGFMFGIPYKGVAVVYEDVSTKVVDLEPDGTQTVQIMYNNRTGSSRFVMVQGVNLAPNTDYFVRGQLATMRFIGGSPLLDKMVGTTSVVSEFNEELELAKRGLVGITAYMALVTTIGIEVFVVIIYQIVRLRKQSIELERKLKVKKYQNVK